MTPEESLRVYIAQRKAQIDRDIAQQWEDLRSRSENLQDKVMLAWVIESRVLDEMLYRLDHLATKASPRYE